MSDLHPVDAALELAKRLLALRDHSSVELTRKLMARGHQDAAIAEALDRLKTAGLIDESRLIDRYIEERAARGFGPLRVRAALIEKGLPSSLIDLHLKAIEDDWPAYLAEVHDRRFGNNPPTTQAEYGRQGRFLEQRGFPAEMIRRVLRWPD